IDLHPAWTGSPAHRISIKQQANPRGLTRPLTLRVRGATCVLLKAGGTDAVRDEVSLSGYERVQHDVEVIPHAFDGTLVAQSADRHLECEELPRRSAGSRCTGCAVRDARRITHDPGRFSRTRTRPSSRGSWPGSR